MDTRAYATFVVLLLVAGAIGCARHTSVARTARPVRKAAPTQMQWGPAAEGLQCRLRPVKRACPAGESPAFKIDLRNRGSRVFAYVQSDRIPLDRFAIDGSWRPWPDRRPTTARSWPSPRRRTHRSARNPPDQQPTPSPAGPARGSGRLLLRGIGSRQQSCRDRDLGPRSRTVAVEQRIWYASVFGCLAWRRPR